MIKPYFTFEIHFKYTETGELVVRTVDTKNEISNLGEYSDFFDFYKEKQDEEAYGGLTEPYFKYALDKYRNDDLIEMLKDYLREKPSIHPYYDFNLMRDTFGEKPDFETTILQKSNDNAVCYIYHKDRVEGDTFYVRYHNTKDRLSGHSVRKIPIELGLKMEALTLLSGNDEERVDMDLIQRVFDINAERPTSKLYRHLNQNSLR